jgi:flagellin-like protein
MRDSAVSPVVGVILMVLITIILAYIIAVFSVGEVEQRYYKIQTENLPDQDFLLIRTIFYSDDSPLPNVTINVREHGEGRLLNGPYMTNKSGYTSIQIPKGYDKYFDVVGEYNNVTITSTIDTRPPLVSLEDKLGNLGIALIILFVGFIGSALGWFFRGWISKKNKKLYRLPTLK